MGISGAVAETVCYTLPDCLGCQGCRAITLFLIQEKLELILPGTTEQCCFLPSPNPALRVAACQLPCAISKTEESNLFLVSIQL